jgi:hypothetical protein
MSDLFHLLESGSLPVATRMGRRVKISTRIPILATRMRARLAKKIERMIAIGHRQLSRK